MVTIESLRKIADTEIELAGPRYTPGIDNEAPNIKIKSLLEELDCLVRSKQLMRILPDFFGNFDDFFSNVSEINRLFTDKLSQLEIVKKLVSKLISLPLSDHFNELSHLCEIVDQIYSILESHRSVLGEKQREGKKISVEHQNKIQGEMHLVKNAIGKIRELYVWTNKKAFDLIDSPFLFLSGDAGSGKTHFLCDLTQERLKNGYPTLLILGQKFTKITDPLGNIASETKLAKNKAELLAGLQELAMQSGERALIIIDAINEGDYKGWMQALRTLVEYIKTYPAVAVIISARVPYQKIILNEENKDLFLLSYHLGFEDVEFDAFTKFFEYYEIPIPEVPLLSKEFSNPLFLKIFCETFKNLTKKGKKTRLKEVYMGQKTMTKIFEEYVKHQGKSIEKKFKLPAKTCWNIVKGNEPSGSSTKIGIAALMAEHNCDWILPEDLNNILESHTKLKGKNLDELATSMIEHAILARDIKWNNEPFDIIRFPYQKMSDHIIARSLLDRHLKAANTAQDLRDAFSQANPLGKLFMLGRFGQYAEPGLALAVTLEFPERIKGKEKGWNSKEKEMKEISEFLPEESRSDDFFRNIFLPGLYWRSKNHFSDCTKYYIDALLTCKDKELVRKTLEILTTLATRHNHPYNAKHLYRYLKKLTLVEKDLLWTEYLRHAHSPGSSSVIFRLLRYLDRSPAVLIANDSVENLLYILALFLSSTETKLRDRATRLLVVYGKKIADKLFGLCLDSLNLNDPYISERMLAASYGVAMRSLSDTSIAKECVMSFARELYIQMFAEDAPNSTTHFLSRDYAARIIQLAEFIKSGFFTEMEVNRTKAPFLPMGILHWGRSEDKDIGKYKDNCPIGFDFENNALKYLIERDYFSLQTSNEFNEIKAKILWRLYNLGYEFSAFGEIDRSICMLNYSYGNSDIKWAGGYGQKYCWIAYYELAGWLFDRKELPNLMDGYRISEIKIDPTFPSMDHAAEFLLDETVLGKKDEMRGADWVNNGRVPNVTSILHRQTINDVNGPWILLDGHLSQENKSCQKQIFSFIRGLLVSKEDKDEIVQLLEKHNIDDVTIPEINSDYLVYAGEIPWCENFVEYEQKYLKIRIGTNRKQVKKNAFVFKVFLPVRAYSWSGGHNEENKLGRTYILEKQIIDTFKLIINPDGMSFFDASGAQITCTIRLSASYNYKYDLIYMKKDFLDDFLAKTNMALLWVTWGERLACSDFCAKQESSYAKFKIINQYKGS